MTWWRRRGVPVLMQTETSECGLACLAMIASYHGLPMGVSDLRARFPVTLRGLRLSRLLEIASSIGLPGRPFRADLEALPRLTTPCLLHWEMNHFVVLVSASRRRIVIHDPRSGRLVLSMQAASRAFTGVAVEFEPATAFAASRGTARVSLRAITGGIIGLGSNLAKVLVTAAAAEVVALLLPLMTQLTVDMAVPTADVSLLTSAALGFLALLVMQTALTALRNWIVIFAGLNVSLSWGRNVFEHLIHLPLTYFSNRSLGDILSRFDAIKVIQNTITTRFVEVVLDGVTAFLMAAVLLAYDVRLSLLTGGAFIAYAALRLLSYRAFNGANASLVNAGAVQQSFLVEALRASQTIKLQNSQTRHAVRYAHGATEVYNHSLRMQKLNIGFGAAGGLIFGVLRIALLWFGGRLVIDGAMSVGMLMVFVLYSTQFTERAGKLMDYLIEFRMLRLQTERLADIVLATREAHAEGRADVPSDAAVAVALRDVSFRYDEGGAWVLRHADLRVHAGESVAIVGPSGCGKSTLAKLLVGLLQPADGSIAVDGRDIREIGFPRLRAITSTVLEEDFLLAGSIEQNIHFFSDEPDRDRVEHAARRASVHADIDGLPLGYDSHVGDLGSALSAGQEQRVLLARALYREPSLLILDEATSHLDVANERCVSAALASLPMTRIIIAHRPETIASADRVFRLHEGRLSECTAYAPDDALAVAHGSAP